MAPTLGLWLAHSPGVYKALSSIPRVGNAPGLGLGCGNYPSYALEAAKSLSPLGCRLAPVPLLACHSFPIIRALNRQGYLRLLLFLSPLSGFYPESCYCCAVMAHWWRAPL